MKHSVSTVVTRTEISVLFLCNYVFITSMIGGINLPHEIHISHTYIAKHNTKTVCTIGLIHKQVIKIVMDNLSSNTPHPHLFTDESQIWVISTVGSCNVACTVS